MTHRHARIVATLCLSGLIGASSSLRGQQQTTPPQDLPRFTSSVEVTTLDVSVFDGQGRPVKDLGPEDFIVTVDKTRRQVVSAEWVQLEMEAKEAPAPPAGYSSNEGSSGGRLIMMVVDQPNIRFGGTIGIRKAMNGFIDRLQPSDRTAIIGLGRGAASVTFTADKTRLKKTIELLNGQHQELGIMLHNISISEAQDVERGVPSVLGEIVRRECVDSLGAPLEDQEMDACIFEIQAEARQIYQTGSTDGRDTINTLRALLNALKAIDGPKTVVFVSEGFMVDNMQAEVAALGTLASAARTSIYSLKLDDTLFTMDASMRRASNTRMNDRMLRAEGMEILSGASRGTLINVIGNGTNVFDRIESELAGFYLLAVESGSADKDGKPHPVSVTVSRRGLSVRSRRAIISSPATDNTPKSPRESVLAALTTPLPIAALPLRVATYSLQGPEADRVQLLIHADVGTDYPTSRVVSLGFTITDLDGRPVDGQAATARLPPIMTGVPSALQYTGGTSIPPGDYILKLAFVEGDRVGTVEHTIHAGITSVGELRLSDLMVGGPINSGVPLFQPTVGHTVIFGSVHGYVEAYGPLSNGVKARFEVASTPDGPALVSGEVPPYAAGPSRALFSQMLSVRQLPPGLYHLRATMTPAEGTPTVLTSTFEVARPAVLMTSATASEAVFREVYLPVTETMLSAPFDLSAALKPGILDTFRKRVPADRLPAFERGVQALETKSYVNAESSFKEAMSVDAESSAALTYMAATYAASGHDPQAASAWQTALVDGSEFPEIYEWLAGALMRNHDLGTARGMLEEAARKWPSDVRFARPVAMVYATFGQGPEAVRSLERHLTASPDDAEAALLGVEWIYQLRAAGAVAHSPAEDLALAKKYADTYLKTNGPQAALVKQWIDYLERMPAR